jgi:hypothetical protein
MNIPAFQRYRPVARYSVAVRTDGFSTNSRTEHAPGWPANGSPRCT